MLAPLQPISFTNFKVGRKGVYITRTCLQDNFQIWSYIYIFKLLNQYLYLCSREVTPRTRHRGVQGSNPVRIFCLFFLCFFSSFFHLLFLVWEFDVLFVGVLVVLFLMVTVNRRGRYYY